VEPHDAWSIIRLGATRVLRVEGYDGKLMSVFSANSEESVHSIIEREVQTCFLIF
jgi:hypothetical protein